MISQPGRSLRADAFGLHDNFTSWAWEILCRRLSGQRGIVSSRVALLLRSAEIKPWLWDLCVRRSAIQHLLQWCTHCHRRCFFPFLLLHISVSHKHTLTKVWSGIFCLYIFGNTRFRAKLSCYHGSCGCFSHIHFDDIFCVYIIDIYVWGVRVQSSGEAFCTVIPGWKRRIPSDLRS